MFICYLCRAIQCFTSSNYCRISCCNEMVVLMLVLVRCVLRAIPRMNVIHHIYFKILLSQNSYGCRHSVLWSHSFFLLLSFCYVRMVEMMKQYSGKVFGKRVECIINNDRVQSMLHIATHSAPLNDIITSRQTFFFSLSNLLFAREVKKSGPLRMAFLPIFGL